jgi:hypothetical protein
VTFVVEKTVCEVGTGRQTGNKTALLDDSGMLKPSDNVKEYPGETVNLLRWRLTSEF